MELYGGRNCSASLTQTILEDVNCVKDIILIRRSEFDPALLLIGSHSRIVASTLVCLPDVYVFDFASG